MTNTDNKEKRKIARGMGGRERAVMLIEMVERGGGEKSGEERGSVVSKILCTFESLSGIRIFFEIREEKEKKEESTAV